jgi:tetratricopeptide (TPR) repeat protein
VFSEKLLGSTLLLTALMLAGSCSKGPTRQVERIAILPLENLTSEAAFDWVSGGAQNVLVRQLTGAGNTLPLAVPNTREARLQSADRAVEAYLSADANLLRIHAVVEDLEHLKAASEIDISGPRQKGLLPLLDQLSKAINPAARAFSTANGAAFESYAKGDFEQAVKLDPGFGAAYLNWLVALRSKGDREAGAKVLAEARAQGTRLNELDRAQIDVASGWLDPADRDAHRVALMRLAGIVKNDAQLMRELSEAALVARNFKAAAEWLEKAAAIEPTNSAIWNSMAYANALGGDLAAAEQSIAQYRKLAAPSDANPSDTTGEVYYLSGKFAEAEKAFVDAFQKNPHFLAGAMMYKAAQARLMTGDANGATGLFDKYLEYKKSVNDPDIEGRRATWEFLIGRRKAALERISKQSSSRARAQQSLMLLIGGDRAAARKQAEAAMQPPAPDRQLAPIALFMSGSAASVPEWRESADRFFGAQSPPVLKNQFMAYALFIQKEYAEVAALLGQQVMEASPLAESFHKELVAAALVAAGRETEAQPFVAAYPLPDATNESVLAALIFPRLFETRAAVFAKLGKTAEAKAMRDLAAKFAPR